MKDIELLIFVCCFSYAILSGNPKEAPKPEIAMKKPQITNTLADAIRAAKLQWAKEVQEGHLHPDQCKKRIDTLEEIRTMFSVLKEEEIQRLLFRAENNETTTSTQQTFW